MEDTHSFVDQGLTLLVKEREYQHNTLPRQDLYITHDESISALKKSQYKIYYYIDSAHMFGKEHHEMQTPTVAQFHFTQYFTCLLNCFLFAIFVVKNRYRY
jgi:hypothetical protein